MRVHGESMMWLTYIIKNIKTCSGFNRTWHGKWLVGWILTWSMPHNKEYHGNYISSTKQLYLITHMSCIEGHS